MLIGELWENGKKWGLDKSEHSLRLGFCFRWQYIVIALTTILFDSIYKNSIEIHIRFAILNLKDFIRLFMKWRNNSMSKYEEYLSQAVCTESTSEYDDYTDYDDYYDHSDDGFDMDETHSQHTHTDTYDDD